MPEQLFEPIGLPSWWYPQNFRLHVPETNATAQQRLSVPDPPPRPWKSLADFCVPKATANPLYKGLRILPLSWRLHFKNTPVDRGAGGIQNTELIGPAMDLGEDLGIKTLAPRVEPHPEYLGLFWRWDTPDGGEWDNYVFCAAFTANKWRVPHEGGYRVQIGFAQCRANTWTFLIGGANKPPYFAPWSPLEGNEDIGQMVYYLLIHKDDQAEGLTRGLAGVVSG